MSDENKKNATLQTRDELFDDMRESFGCCLVKVEEAIIKNEIEALR